MIQFTIPADFASITVAQYSAFHTARTDVERMMAATGLSRKLAGGIKADQAQVIIQAFNDVCADGRGKHERVVTFDKVEYGFIPSIDDIVFDEYIDATGMARLVFSDGKWSELAKLLAIFYRPITARYGDRYSTEPYDSDKLNDRAAIMQRMDMVTAMGVPLFFSILLNECAKDFQLSSLQMMKDLRTEMKTTLDLIDEEQTSRSLVSGDGITY